MGCFYETMNSQILTDNQTPINYFSNFPQSISRLSPLTFKPAQHPTLMHKTAHIFLFYFKQQYKCLNNSQSHNSKEVREEEAEKKSHSPQLQNIHTDKKSCGLCTPSCGLKNIGSKTYQKFIPDVVFCTDNFRIISRFCCSCNRYLLLVRDTYLNS